MYYKIQQVICIHAIILLYFEKKITDDFFEIYKRSSKTKLMSQTEFAKALCVSYSIVSRRGIGLFCFEHAIDFSDFRNKLWIESDLGIT